MSETQTPTDELLRLRLSELMIDIESDLATRASHEAAAKTITDGLPTKRLKCNRLKRALGIPCREKKSEPIIQ